EGLLPTSSTTESHPLGPGGVHEDREGVVFCDVLTLVGFERAGEDAAVVGHPPRFCGCRIPQDNRGCLFPTATEGSCQQGEKKKRDAEGNADPREQLEQGAQDISSAHRNMLCASALWSAPPDTSRGSSGPVRRRVR